MSSLGKLAGVECALCRRKGHRCQAQLLAPEIVLRSGEDVLRDVPMCLRCADGEACCFETSAALELGEWRREPEGRVDPCMIPKPTGADLEFVRRMGKPESTHSEGGRRGAEKRLGRVFYSGETRAAMLEDLRTMTTQQVADKWSVPRGTVGSLVSNDRRRTILIALKRKREPRQRRIKGETVRIAPLASMG